MRQATVVRRSILAGFAAIALLFGAIITTFSVSAHGGGGWHDDTVVKTANGKIKGTYNDGARVFRGIPYAAPPVGDLRWQEPADVANWSGVRDATEFSSTCAAVPLPEQIGIPSQPGSTDEDCLYLNVYTPKNVKHDTPVMVFIHGGGFMVGAGSDHEAEALARKGDVVVVTINYRLGAFGWLALPELSAANGGTSGNLGMLDQQKALEWIQQNIGEFGGNKDNVTLFGISAGGRSICEHLVAPESAGLFDRGVVQSSACVRDVKDLATAESQGVGVAEDAGCADSATRVDCLRSKSTTEILDAAGFNIGLWGPNVDGVVIPQDFTTAIESGNFNQVPIMEGTTALEYLWHVTLAFDGVGSSVTAEQYPSLVGSMFGANKDAILAEYPLEDYDSPSLALANLVTDVNYSCTTRQTSQLLAQHVPVYQYEFADQDAPDYLWEGLRGPVHASETNYLFQPPNAKHSGYFTYDQYKLSNKMIDYWAEFAEDGNPNKWGLPYWPAFNGTEKVQVLAPNAIGASTTFATDHHCSFWDSL